MSYSIKKLSNVEKIPENDWPVVYILKNSKTKDVYIGETTNLKKRLNDHNKTKPELVDKWYIVHTNGNKSLTFYLESFLIHKARMDWKSVNTLNIKKQEGELFKKDHFYSWDKINEDVVNIWDDLVKAGAFSTRLRDMKEHYFNEFHPDFDFTDKQLNVISEIENSIINEEVLFIEGVPGSGKTIIIAKLINDFHINNKSSNKVIGVYSASTQNKKIIKHFISLMNSNKVIFIDKLNNEMLNKKIDHLIIDEAQSLQQGNYGTKLYSKLKYENEIDFLKDATKIKSFTYMFDTNQVDYFNNIEMEEYIKNNKVLKLDEQKRIKAPIDFQIFFQELLGIEDRTNKTFDLKNYKYKIEVIMNKDLSKSINKIKDDNSKILIPYNKEIREDGFNGVLLNMKRAWECRNTKDLFEELDINSPLTVKHSRGRSIKNAIVLFGNDIFIENNKINFDVNKWKSNTIQQVSDSKKKKIMQGVYYSLLTRATDNLIISCVDKEVFDYLNTFINDKLKY